METIGGKGIDKIYDVATMPDGFLLVGSTTSFGVDKDDVYIVKVDNTGKMVWNRTWGDWESDRGYAITRTKDNNYVITGASSVYYGIGDDVLFLKINEDGKTLSNRSYGGNAWDWGNDVIELSDGNILIGGVTEQFWVHTYDCYLVKTNAKGALLWKRTIETDGDFQMQRLIESNDGNYLIIGSITDVLGHDRDIMLIKANPDGKEIWTRVFGGEEKEYGMDIIDTSDGYMVLCKSEVSGENEYDTSLMKLDYEGRYNWSKSIGDIRDDECNRIIKTGADEYVLVGKTFDVGKNGADILLMKIDSKGEVLFTEKYGTDSYDSGVQVIEQEGKLVIFGDTGGLNSNILVLRIATEVNQLHINSEYGTVTGGGAYLNGTEVGLSIEEEIVYLDGKTRQFFMGWIDEDTGQLVSKDKSTVLAVTSNQTLSTVWNKQYYVEILSAPGISVNPDSGWFDAESEIIINGIADNNTSIQGWNGNGPGSYTGSNAKARIHVNGPITQTPLSTQVEYFELTLDSEYGTPTGSGVFQENTTVSFSLEPTIVKLGPNTRYSFTGWSKDGTHYSEQSMDSLVLREDTVLTANWEKQYHVNSSVEGGEGKITGSGWLKEGAKATITCVPNTGFSFVRWDIEGVEQSEEIQITVDSPSTITALLNSSKKCSLNMVSEYGEIFGPSTGFKGENVTFSVYPEIIDLSENTRVVFQGWTTPNEHGYEGTDNPVTMTLEGNTVQEVIWAREFYIFAGDDEIDGWYEENSSIGFDSQEEGSWIPKSLRYSADGEKIANDFKITGPLTLSSIWSYSMTNIVIAVITSSSIGYTSWRGMKIIAGIQPTPVEEEKDSPGRMDSVKLKISAPLNSFRKSLKPLSDSVNRVKEKIVSRLKRTPPESK